MSYKFRLAAFITMAIVLISSFVAVSGEYSTLHKKLGVNSNLTHCYCISFQECIAAPSGIDYCGDGVDCALFDSGCASTE